MTFRGSTTEYQVREDEAVRSLMERVRKDVNVQRWWLNSQTMLQQDGKELSASAKLGSAKFNAKRPVEFHLK